MSRILMLFISMAILIYSVGAQLTTNTDPDAARIVTTDLEAWPTQSGIILRRFIDCIDQAAGAANTQSLKLFQSNRPLF